MRANEHSLKKKTCGPELTGMRKGAQHSCSSAAVRTDTLSRTHTDGMTCVDRLFSIFDITSTKGAMLPPTCAWSWARAQKGKSVAAQIKIVNFEVMKLLK